MKLYESPTLIKAPASSIIVFFLEL